MIMNTPKRAGVLAVLALLWNAGCGESVRVAPPGPDSPKAEDGARIPATRDTPAIENGASLNGAPTHTNLVLISVDALRADRLGCYGHTRETSPAIDALARDGAVFEFAFAPKGSTWPSLATLQTGLHPVTHGVRYNGMVLRSEHEALAETLKAAGYQTAVIIANGGQQKWDGFDTKNVVRDEPRDALVTEKAVQWLRDHARDKFYLWLHYFSPHGPYTPPDGYDTFVDKNYSGPIDGSYETLTRVFTQQRELSKEDLAYVNGLYDGEVRYADHQIGAVLAELKSLGVYENTLVVLTADHGEELYEHHKYFHHQASLYDGTVRVPLIFSLRDKIPTLTRNQTPVSLVDVAPTILELLGVRRPAAYQGASLAPAFRAEPLTHGPVYGEWGDKMLFVRTADYKYISNPSAYQPPVKREREVSSQADTPRRRREHTLPVKSRELYKISSDPREMDERSSTDADSVEKLETELDTFKSTFGWQLGEKAEEQLQKDLDPETRKELEAMGYVL